MREKRRRSSYGDNQLAPSPEPDRPRRKGSTSSVDSRSEISQNHPEIRLRLT